MTSKDVLMAQQFATNEHVVKRGQLYGVLPYTHHLERVAKVLERFGYNDPVLAVAAWLHDVMEDCSIKRKTIEEIFGPDVADVVWRVTNEKAENRKVRGLLTYPKIRESAKATVLKLADRISNVENGGSLVDMYRNEYEDFRRMLHSDGVCDDLWSHLDQLLTKKE